MSWGSVSPSRVLALQNYRFVQVVLSHRVRGKKGCVALKKVKFRGAEFRV